MSIANAARWATTIGHITEPPATGARSNSGALDSR